MFPARIREMWGRRCEGVGRVWSRFEHLLLLVLPLRAAASLYGGGIAPDLLDQAPALHGPMLLIWGGLDKHIGPEQRAAVADPLRQSGKT